MMWRRFQRWAPITGSSRPISSRSSRRSASRWVSPASMPPPGSAHRVASGNSKRTSNTRSSSSTTSARTASRMRSPLVSVIASPVDVTDHWRASLVGGVAQPVVERLVHLVDVLALLAHGELLGIAGRNPDVTAQRLDRRAVDAGLEHLGRRRLAGLGLDDVGDDGFAGLELF